MANYNQVSYGSEGRDVTELQKLLNKNGYSLDEDGVFGSKTQAAVRDYQKKNNLAVDGIVGNNTWGALTNAAGGSSAGSSSGGSSSGSSTQAPAPAPAPTYGAGDYKPSDTVLAAEQLLQQQLANKPGAYESAWQVQLNDTINKILNREKFSYDINGDPLYNQYMNNAVVKGNLAMMDTIGQASAMTGGYGNSYAQNVGQQAYQGYIQEANNLIPELYQMALNQYNAEGDALMNQYAMLGAQEEQDYGRYRDQVGDYQNELARLTDDARYQAEMDYSKFLDDRATSQWQAQFDEAKRQYDQEYEQSAGKSSSGSNTGSRTGGFDNGKYGEEIVKKAQDFVGASVDGKWGNESADKAKEMGFNSLADVIAAMEGGKTELTVDENKVKNFLSKLPYVPANGDSNAWKKIVDSRLEEAFNNGTLNDAEVEAILNQLNLD